MRIRFWLVTIAAVAGVLGSGAAVASAKRIKMPTLAKEIQTQRQIWQAHVFAPVGSLTPPAPPCPENGLLPAPFSNCGLPEFPATTLPWPTNMAYWHGHVAVKPKVYLVYWGWGDAGAFPGKRCSSESFSEGAVSVTLPCDPDGAGRYMANFVYQLGGTQWAGTQTQYYQVVSGRTQHITNPRNQLGGVWVDNGHGITSLPKTSGTAKPGSGNTYTDFGREAAAAVAHFGIKDLADANIALIQPPHFSDPNALNSGYCAFHDYTQPGLEGGIYNGIKPGIAYTNMPYALAINSGGVNECGENAVNSGRAGKLDGFSIVFGHEIEETTTDPGAEDIQGGSGVGKQTYLGGWYDAADANENGDKCAWVGENLLTGQGTEPVPGAMGDIKGNGGQTFAVQSLWSNDAAGGAGYCAGAGTDLPVPNGGSSSAPVAAPGHLGANPVGLPKLPVGLGVAARAP